MSFESQLIERYAGARERLFGATPPPPKPPRPKRLSPFHPARALEHEPRWVRLFGGKPIVEIDAFRPSPADLTWKRIAQEVAQKHSVPMTDMFSARRNKEAVAARHEAFYRCSVETSMSLPQIGRRFGRDHTTILYGIRKFKRMMEAQQ